ncbi:unnamed protein product [Prunus brigantina]
MGSPMSLRRLRDMKQYRYLPLIAFSALVLLCILLKKSSQPIGTTHDVSLLKFQTNPESAELVEVLRRASMADRTIILTIVEEAWTGPGSVLDLFLESFRIGQGTKWLLNHLIIVTLGRQAFQYFKSLHPHCFQLTPIGVSKPSTGEQLHQHSRDRHDLLHKVLQLGYNLVFTEVDVMWFRNPIPHFNPQDEVTIPCDLEPKYGSNKQDRGLFYVKSNYISVKFFNYLKLVGVLYPNTPFESLCEIATEQEIMEMLGMRIKFLYKVYFGGFCQPLKNNSEVYTMQANCCEKIESKVHDLKLVLDDWSNFTGQSSNHSLGTLSSWRAPDKCNQ